MWAPNDYGVNHADWNSPTPFSLEPSPCLTRSSKANIKTTSIFTQINSDHCCFIKAPNIHPVLSPNMSFSPSQLNTIEVIERVTSVFSLVGTSIVITSFLASSAFRRPINRLIFYAVWGNTLNTVATLTGLAGIRAGQRSALCQFQAFLCQWCVNFFLKKRKGLGWQRRS